MRILVLGSGGREHALIWKLKQDSNVKEIIVAPGNGGTAMLARNIDADLNDINALVSLAKEVEADLVIPGPELPLVYFGVEPMIVFRMAHEYQVVNGDNATDACLTDSHR